MMPIPSIFLISPAIIIQVFYEEVDMSLQHNDLILIWYETHAVMHFSTILLATNISNGFLEWLWTQTRQFISFW
jgi:hypothetical protein